MIGAIIGDIVGSRFEFHNHRSTEFDFFHADCNFTDDTVMTVAVADAILSDRPFGEVMYEYGHKHPKRGYGGRFYKWLLSRNPKPYNSFGNGSAMRVSPCAFLANGNREQALTWATASAVCTHNHPEGVKGAMVITDCILKAQKGYSKDEIRRDTEELYGYDLNFTIDEIRPHYQFNETCQGSVPQAIECFLESHDFASAIRIAVSLGGDSDTIANITGGIAEAYYGVPDWMRDKAMAMLPEEMQSVLNKMYGTDLTSTGSHKKYGKLDRITPDHIDTLLDGQIFVFGSNALGHHGGGAARVAMQKFGAIFGQGDGLQGQSYAISTMEGMEPMRENVNRFISFAKQHPELTFLVTRIGCGIAGYNDWEVAPLFTAAVDVKNIWLPKEFWKEIV